MCWPFSFRSGILAAQRGALPALVGASTRGNFDTKAWSCASCATRALRAKQGDSCGTCAVPCGALYYPAFTSVVCFGGLAPWPCRWSAPRLPRPMAHANWPTAPTEGRVWPLCRSRSHQPVLELFNILNSKCSVARSCAGAPPRLTDCI